MRCWVKPMTQSQLVPSILSANHAPAHGASRLMVVSDPHLGGTGAKVWHDVLAFEQVPGLIDVAAQQARRLGSEAMIVLGDLADRGDEPSLRRLRAGLGRFRGPARVVAGNHDRATDNSTFEMVFSRPGPGPLAVTGPENLGALTVAGVAVSSDDAGKTCTGAPPDLSAHATSPVIVLSHYPLLGVGHLLSAAGLRDSGPLLNEEECLTPFAERRAPTIVLHGHLHARVEATQGPLLQIGVAALVERPHEIAIVDVAVSGDVWVHVRRYTAMAALPSEPRMPVVAPDESWWTWSATGWRRSDSRPPEG